MNKRRKRNKYIRQEPLDGMMYSSKGYLIYIRDVENIAKAHMIGHDKDSKMHWSNDQSYNWNRNQENGTE